MACRLVGAKPLSEPMLEYCLFYPQEQTSMKYLPKFIYFHSRKCIWKVLSVKRRPFCLSLNVHLGEAGRSSTHHFLNNGLSPSRHQAIIWTNAGILLILHLGTYFSEVLIWIHLFPFKKLHLKMSYAKRRPFCLSLNVHLAEAGRSATHPYLSYCQIHLLTMR